MGREKERRMKKGRRERETQRNIRIPKRRNINI